MADCLAEGATLVNYGLLSGLPCQLRADQVVFQSITLTGFWLAKVLGGLDRATRRRLDRAAADLAAGRTPAPPGPKIKPGTRLLREWQGKVYEVIVLEEGVEYRGEAWLSLSAVAREITGTRWSGPRFFGLKGS